jgi:hypothetical protein
MKPVLEYRWKLTKDEDDDVLVYYGLRNYPDNLRQVIKVTPEAAGIIHGFNGVKELSAVALKGTLKHELNALIADRIIVDIAEVKNPATKERFQTCTKCINNDLILPGLEFNEEGVCAFCQAYQNADQSRSTLTNAISETDLREKALHNKDSRFDVMVLFTGGKDSTFLVWHLAKRMNLRVLAASWNVPYTHKTAHDNMKKTLEAIPGVEFVEWTVSPSLLKQAMRDQHNQVGYPCLCPTVAFGLFYPLALSEKIPYVLFGMEDVQSAVMDYVFTAPKSLSGTTVVDERTQTINFLKFRAFPRKPLSPVYWQRELANYHCAIQNNLPCVFDQVRSIVKKAEDDKDMKLPLIKRLSTRESYGTWKNVIQLLHDEVGWEMPPGQKNLLHTSCMIEQAKDYLQYQKYLKMETVFFPQAIVEISTAVFWGLLTREEALEQATELGFPDRPPIMNLLASDLKLEM